MSTEQTAALFGRAVDLDAIREHLASARLVTVLGIGGVGKTALARAVADELPTRVDWVDLAAVAVGSDAGAATIRMLNASSIEAWAVGNAGAVPMVVLDNCEHILADAAEMARRLLSAHPGVRVLATSRAELGVDGEIRYRLSPLSIRAGADEPSPAAQLFTGRSRGAGASWPDSGPNRDAVESIVSRLDGIPLAIELAAAQALAVSPAELAALMTESLDVLSDRSSPDAAHGSLRRVIATSYERLSPSQQRFFRAMAPLGFPFDLELASALADLDRLEALDLVTGLLRESLLTVEHEDDGSSRFRLLEPVREYALEQLVNSDEASVVEDRFVDALAMFADQVVASALERYDRSILAKAAERFSYIARAIELAVARDQTPGRAYRLLLPLFAPSSGPRLEVAALALAVRDRWPDTDDPLRAEALAVMAHIAMVVDDDDRATALANLVLAEPSASPVGRLVACRTLGVIAAFDGDYAAATRWLELALDEAESFGGLFGRELRATVLGFRVDDQHALEELAALGDEAAAEDDDVVLGWILAVMINTNLHLGRLVEANRCLDRAELVAARSPLRYSMSSFARSRAVCVVATGDWPAAAAAVLRCLDLMVDWGDVEGIAATLRLAATGAEACGEPALADRLWRCRPTGRAGSVLPDQLLAEERRLIERCGPPLPLSLGEAVDRAREILVDASAPVVNEPVDETTLRFEPGCELDLGRHELRRDGIAIHVEPQVFEVLVHLATNADRLVTREELMDEVWSTRFVSAATVNSRIRSARAATGDDGKRQAVIRTVHGRGFQFVAELVQ
ncbi:MAG: winged helix-turn-helix domain-containing protein [Actinomycetota bacterium]